jgi:2-polyprenyl-3-methyl-5-hydroxy-6-metoxy-1,4-benzoquinol methylase
MDRNSVRGCPICEATACEVLHTQRFVLPEGHPLTDGYDVVCCRACGFVYADTAVSQRDYDTFYRQYSKYEDQKTSTGGGDTPWDARRLHDAAVAVADFVGSRDARILDVGCANGGLLRALKGLGFHDLTGLDPSPACAENTRRIPGVRAEAGSLADPPAGFGSFDCVILSHVLEHVQDLRSSIAAIAHLTAEDGCVYLETPDAGRYDECLVAPFQDFNTEHINHFSLGCLVNLARVAGLTPERHGFKTLESPPPLPYPAVFAIFRKTDAQAALAPDAELRGKINAYIASSRDLMRKIDARLREVVSEQRELIVWGTGQLAMKLLAETALGDARIAAFIDGNPINHGKRLRGRPILSPQEVRGLPHPIVITSMLHQREILEGIRGRLGLSNPVITLADLPSAAVAV